jgi:hypothetical protein
LRQTNESPSAVLPESVSVCPYCRADLETGALKCRNCSEWLGPRKSDEEGKRKTRAEIWAPMVMSIAAVLTVVSAVWSTRASNTTSTKVAELGGANSVTVAKLDLDSKREIQVLSERLSRDNKSKDVDLRLLELAIDIVKAPPRGDPQDESVKAWAVQVINSRLEQKLKIRGDAESAFKRGNVAPTVSLGSGGDRGRPVLVHLTAASDIESAMVITAENPGGVELTGSPRNQQAVTYPDSNGKLSYGLDVRTVSPFTAVELTFTELGAKEGLPDFQGTSDSDGNLSHGGLRRFPLKHRK